jgi:alanine dehydrogenase
MQNDAGGKGILLGGEAGVPPAEVAVIGAGIAGTAATRVFLAMGAHVTVLDTNIMALRQITEICPGVSTLLSFAQNITQVCLSADVLVGTVLVPGEPTPVVVTREMVKSMKPRSIIMDVSIDEGGCVETSRPTTHEHPTYVEEGVIHYCVPNIPSVVARTSTYAFLNAAFPYIMEIVNKSIDRALVDNPAIELGTVVYRGELRHIYRPDSMLQTE